jgi:hypothetical protein
VFPLFAPIPTLEALFYYVDDFCRWFEPQWQKHLLGEGLQRRSRSRNFSLSEIMTILIAFHQSAYRNFKWFYKLVCRYWHQAFPGLVSYHRFVEWMPRP